MEVEDRIHRVDASIFRARSGSTMFDAGFAKPAAINFEIERFDGRALQPTAGNNDSFNPVRDRVKGGSGIRSRNRTDLWKLQTPRTSKPPPSLCRYYAFRRTGCD